MRTSDSDSEFSGRVFSYPVPRLSARFLLSTKYRAHIENNHKIRENTLFNESRLRGIQLTKFTIICHKNRMSFRHLWYIYPQSTTPMPRYHDTILKKNIMDGYQTFVSFWKILQTNANNHVFFFLPHLFSAEGLKWMTVLLGSFQAMPFLYRRLRMCMKGWAKSKPQLLRGGLGDGW